MELNGLKAPAAGADGSRSARGAAARMVIGGPARRDTRAAPNGPAPLGTRAARNGPPRLDTPTALGGPARPGVLALLGALALFCAASVAVAGRGGDAGGVAAAAAGPSGGKAEKASSVVVARLRDTIRLLTAPEMEGRGPGTAGLEQARDHLVQSFVTVGLKPGGENGTYLQAFTPRPEEIRTEVAPAAGTEWGRITLHNVVGVLPGNEPQAGCVVVGAHYDHLGRSPDGTLLPGADDNASGVAVLLEVAQRIGSEGPLRRTVVFAAFSGEEAGTLGARRYLADPPCPAEQTVAMLNLDTVGRLEQDRLFVFGSATAAEFPAMLRGVNLAVPVELAMPESAPFASDQAPFYEKGIPALHFFSGPNADYHRPGDTEEKINYEGLLTLLDFVRETTVFLAEREAPPAFIPPGAEKAAAQIQATGPARRVSLGTIPDFERQAGGVLVSGTIPGSPAEAAGIQKGDVIVALGAEPVDNLGDFSAALKKRQPGDTVEVVFRRGEEELRRRVAVVERK